MSTIRNFLRVSTCASKMVLRIGEFSFDPEALELRRGDVVQRVPALQGALLMRLAADPGHCVSREVLLTEVWPRRVVNDEVLSRAIADLRHSLGDDARAARYIETVPKRGYRLLADVERVPPAAPVDARAGTRYLAMSWVVVAVAVAVVGEVLAIWNLWPQQPPSGPGVRGNPLTTDNLLRARPFTSEPGRELFPRFTPDARWIVYARAARSAQPVSLRLRGVDGTGDRALVEDAYDNYCGALSPDGAWLAWLREDEVACHLMLRPMLGGEARALATCDVGGGSICPDWSADGRSLVLARDAGLHAIDASNGDARILTRAAPGRRDMMPRYSALDGSVVFWRGDSWGRALWRTDAAGTERALREGDSLAFGHAITRDGHLLLADDSFGQRALVSWSATESILLGAYDARHPDLAADGSLVYELARYDANLWRVNLDGPTAPAQRLTDSARYDSQPDIAPDSRWIAFGSNRDGREAVYLVRADGSEERKLALDPDLRWTAPRWSPDGAELLLQRYDEQGMAFCLHHVADGTTRCPDAWRARWHAGFFVDVDTVGMIDLDPVAPRLWRASRDGSPPQPSAIAAVQRCRSSASHLVCQNATTNGLRLIAPEGGERVLLDRLGPDQRGGWTVARNALYVSLPADVATAGAGVYRIDLESGQQQHLTELRPSAIGEALSVAPDASFLVLARTDGLETDLMYVPPPQP